MSSYYGIVFPEFWTGDTGRAIQEQGGKDAQILALYQMSCRHATMIGLYSLPLRDVRHETGLGTKGLMKALTSLALVGFSEYDAPSEHVWVREMAKFRLGLQKRSPLDPDDRRVKGVQNLYDRLVENPFLEPFFDRYAKELRLKGKRRCGRPPEPLLDVGLRSPLQAPCKPDNRSAVISTQQESGIRDQGSAKSTAASRRDFHTTEKTNGTPALYRRLVHEAREQSITEDHDESISNIAEHFKTLCARRQIAYDSGIASEAIESVLRGEQRRRA